MKRICQFCGNEVEDRYGYSEDSKGPTHTNIVCPICGEYNLYSVVPKFDNENDKVLISSYLFEMNDTGLGTVVSIFPETIKAILNSPLIPKSLSDRICKLCNYVDRHSKYFGDLIPVPLQAIYVGSPGERDIFFESMENEGIINLSHLNVDPLVSLRLKALDFVGSRPIVTRLLQCFVAMWFDSSMDLFFDRIVKPACVEAGYEAIKVSDKEFTGEITDEIIAGIKESAFVIADFTGHRGGVYYEAGYAIGLGKTVIQMCRENDQDKLHFDINHRNTIFWNENDITAFRRRLTNRIRATIGLGLGLTEDLS